MELEFSFSFNPYKYGFVGLVIDWIDKDMKEEPHEIINRLNSVIQGSFEHALSNVRMDKKI